MELWIWCYRLTAFRLTWGNMTGADFQYQQDKYIHVLIIRKKRHTNSLLKSGTRHRCGSTQVSTVLRKSVRFFINKYIVIKIKLSKLRSGQYPVWMTQKPWNPGDFGELKSKKFPNREHAADPPPPPLLSRSLQLRRSFRKSVSIYPRSAPETSFWFPVHSRLLRSWATTNQSARRTHYIV